jgi:hypothetical protein
MRWWWTLAWLAAASWPTVAGASPAAEAPGAPATPSAAGPIAAGVGAAITGGGLALVIADAEDGFAIGGTGLGIVGMAVLMSGTAGWMHEWAANGEAVSTTTAVGIALSTVGVGSVALGGFMKANAESDFTTGDGPTGDAGIAAMAGGGALLAGGIIAYVLADPKADNDATGRPSFHLGPGYGEMLLRF